jgi:hypothetical protein
MQGIFPELTRRFDATKSLGYLNFADGRPESRFRKFLADVFGFVADLPDRNPWATVGAWLAHTVDELEKSGSAAFKDAGQARQVLAAAFDRLPAIYRTHHADLLAHQPDEFLFTAFFQARACEAVLRERAKKPESDPETLAAAAVGALNDYVGYRPIAVLETRPQTDYYPHEKVCPIPIYFPGSGVAPGRYSDLIRPALELISQTEPGLREEACLDPEKLEELSLDPRAADHFHPVNKRPNVLFGEWDPHRIDGRGFYRRFVLRQPTLDALLMWIANGPSGEPSERRFEAAAVLAGTILMGAGVSGSGPTAFDSTVTLASLVQRIARYRDEFYRKLLAVLPGRHGERLRDEATRLKQPFAGVRQYLNQAIATERALHLQERRLAVLFAAMGYPAAARERSARIPAPSVRFSCEVRLRQTEAEFAAKLGNVREAARLLAEAEDLLRRGIDCGAIMDPWNVLGYQGLFPIFPGRDDTVRDPRAEELILTVGRQLDRYARALAAATTAGDDDVRAGLDDAMRSLAGWWDKFATTTVGDLPRVHGGEQAEAAGHVARALALWKQGGGADPLFWRRHREGFRAPAAFAQVIDALLENGDLRAALALLVTWLSESGPDLPLQDPAASFFRLAFRWLRGLVGSSALPAAEKGPLARRFFELLEANADDRWHVPGLARDGAVSEQAAEGEVESGEVEDNEGDGETYASAYEGMTFRDSADDGTEGAVADGSPSNAPVEFALEADAEKFEDRLRFLAAVARLWRSAALPELWPPHEPAAATALAEWLRTARRNSSRLHDLIDQLHAVEVPEPAGGVEGVMEFDRRRVLKGHMLDLAVSTAVETTASARALAAVLSRTAELPPAESGGGGQPGGDDRARPELSRAPAAWQAVAVRLERAVAQADATSARKYVSALVSLFRGEPLLVYPPADGGPPAPALRAQTALQFLESLLARLPRLGLLRETFQLAKLARAMERNDPPEGKRVSSFDQLFRTAVIGVVDALVAAASEWGPDARARRRSAAPDEGDDGPLAPALRQIAESFHKLWLEHSQTLRLSALEAVLGEEDWAGLKQFISVYGGDLFTVRFLTLSNIRGILGRGVVTWLDRMTDPDAGTGQPGETVPKLIDAWAEPEFDKPAAARHLEIVLQALVEHYDEYRDYNTTTTQSDYGDNLYILLDFLRLKVAYDRYAWRLRPLTLAHEVLCRRGHDSLAASWRRFIAGKTNGLADELLTKLTAREAEHGIRVRTVRDRLEERFVQPLQIDQAAARVPRAAAAAKELAGATNPPAEAHPAFVGLLAAIKPLAESPTGVGLDVPSWLRRLEEELRRFRTGMEEVDGDGDEVLLPQGPPLDFSELKRQLNEWERPLGE